MLSHHILRAIALAVLPTFLFAQSFTFDATDVSVGTQLDDRFTQYQIVDVDAAGLYEHWLEQSGLIDVTLVGTAGRFELHLTPWELRADDYRVSIPGQERGGNTNRLRTPTYRGNVTGGGEAIMTFDRKFILGHIERDGVRYSVEPLWRLVDGADENLYIFYDESQSIAAGPDACATDLSEWQPTEGKPRDASKSVRNCTEIELALVADTEMFQAFGNTTSVENFMLGVLADVRTVYDDEFSDEIQWVTSSTTIYTTSNVDPYTNNTDAGVLLGDFRSYSVNNPSSIPGSYDVATLWTNRDFNNGTVGIAYLGAVCDAAFKFNANQNYTNNSVSLRNMWAHELGHNLNSPHDDAPSSTRHIMYPRVNSSNTWSAGSRNTIENFLNAVSCDEACPTEPPVAVADVIYANVCTGCPAYFFDITEGRLDTRQWSFPGADVASSSAINPVVTYSQPGTYTARLSVSNSTGASATTVNIQVSDEGGTWAKFREDFESNDNRRVSFSNPGNDILAWVVTNTDGNRGQAAAMADNGNLDARGSSNDVIRTEFVDLDGLTNPRASLQYAYVRYDGFYRDQMRVFVNQGGQRTQVFFGDENGSGNFATGPDMATQGGGVFVPDEAADWCTTGPICVTIDLAPYVGGGDVRLEIENEAGWGQPLYVDNISIFGTAQSSSLPVEWLSFDAVANVKAVNLDWAVNQDEANEGFAIERSVGSDVEWLVVADVDAVGGAKENARYTYTDHTALEGHTYSYRLRQRDTDGSESLSEIRTVSLDGARQLAAYPNPTSGFVELRGTAADLSFEIFDAVGRRVHSGSLRNGSARVNLAEVPAGIYTVRTETATLRLVRD